MVDVHSCRKEDEYKCMHSAALLRQEAEKVEFIFSLIDKYKAKLARPTI